MYGGGGLVTKSCLTLPTPWTVTASLLCPWDFSGKSIGVGFHFLLQGIFPTEGLSPSVEHCREAQILCVLDLKKKKSFKRTPNLYGHYPV